MIKGTNKYTERGRNNILILSRMKENCLSSDLEDDGADQEEHHDPADGDQEPSVHRDPVQPPASGHDSSQSLTRECLWQHVADIPDTRKLSKSKSKF